MGERRNCRAGHQSGFVTEITAHVCYKIIIKAIFLSFPKGGENLKFNGKNENDSLEKSGGTSAMHLQN
jgi:hypothetical protein